MCVCGYECVVIVERISADTDESSTIPTSCVRPVSCCTAVHMSLASTLQPDFIRQVLLCRVISLPIRTANAPASSSRPARMSWFFFRSFSGVGSMYGQGVQKDRREAPKKFFHVAPPCEFCRGADFHNKPIHYIQFNSDYLFILHRTFFTLCMLAYN